MSQPTETISLNIHVVGDTIDELVCVSVALDAPITQLVFTIVTRYQQLGYGQLQRPIISKVDFSLHDLSNVPTQLQGTRLIPIHLVKQYWDDPAQIDRNHLHVLVRAIVVKPHRPEQKDTLSDLPNFLRQLQIGQQDTAQKFLDGKSASLAATHSQFASQQKAPETAILNGRPQERVGLPVQLFHPVFDKFTKTLESAEVLAPPKYAATEKLLNASPNIYRAEEHRWRDLLPLMTTALASEIVTDIVPKCTANGVVTCVDVDTALKGYCAIIEVKNEVGTGNCDPTIQAAESFAIYWSQEKMTSLRNICCCPSLIIAIAGPWMCVLGAVYLRNPVVQPLTDYIWLGHLPQQDRRLTHMTRVFHAAAVTIDELRKYYKSLFSRPLSLEDLTRFLPYPRQYPDSDGNLVDFDYLGLLDSPLRPVFKASTGAQRDIIVKFAERYSIEAHQMLVPKGLAPKVLYYNADCSH
ncbi:hypothetical protein FRC10_011395, partial [Ceratobasidium sp. 414]